MILHKNHTETILHILYYNIIKLIKYVKMHNKYANEL